MKLKRTLVGSALVALALGVGTSTAQAVAPAQISKLVVNSVSNGVSSELTVTYDSAKPTTQVQQQVATMGLDPSSLTVSSSGVAQITTAPATVSSTPIPSAPKTSTKSSGFSTVQAAGPAAAYTYCNRGYSWTDADGTWGTQRGCGLSYANWYYNIGATPKAIIIGTVLEHGLTWTYNGTNGSRNAPHNEGAAYVFHGTLNPVKGNTFVTYWDEFDFAVIGGGTGNLVIHGSLTYAAAPAPCAATTSTGEASPSATC